MKHFGNSAWWDPIPPEIAETWEILPQEARAGEVILSKRTELGILSNFAATPFLLDRIPYASVEGFWQMMKYPEDTLDERMADPKIQWPHTRSAVAQMTGFEAKEAGDRASALLKGLNINWVTYGGRKIDYYEKSRGEFFDLILRAEWEKLRYNPQVKEILLRTGNLTLRPDHHQPEDSPPAWRYADIWMEIRDELKQDL